MLGSAWWPAGQCPLACTGSNVGSGRTVLLRGHTRRAQLPATDPSWHVNPAEARSFPCPSQRGGSSACRPGPCSCEHKPLHSPILWLLSGAHTFTLRLPLEKSILKEIFRGWAQTSATVSVTAVSRQQNSGPREWRNLQSHEGKCVEEYQWFREMVTSPTKGRTT